MSLTYREVKDIYDVLKDAGATNLSLPEWSNKMNEEAGTDAYSAGLKDNFIKRASVGIDRGIEWTGITGPAEDFGRAFGTMVGDPEAGAEIGKSLPRMTVNFLPFMASGPVGVGGAVLRYGGTALLSGADTYTQTGSPAAGVLSGATAAAFPKVMDFAEQAALKAMGATLRSGSTQVSGQALDLLDIAKPLTGKIEQSKRYFPTKGTSQGPLSFLAGQGAAAGFGEVSGFGQDILAGRPLHNPLSTETLLNLTLGQVPFAGIQAAHRVMGGKSIYQRSEELGRNIEQTTKLLELRAAKEKAAEVPEITTLPDIPTIDFNPETVAENTALITNLFKQRKELELSDLPPEEKVERINALLQQESEHYRKQAGVVTRGTVFGTKLTEKTTRTNVPGILVEDNPERGFRVIKVVDPGDGSIPEEWVGKEIIYSSKFEPREFDDPSMAGTKVFSVPDMFFTVREPYVRNKAVTDPNQPELPTQIEEGTLSVRDKSKLEQQTPDENTVSKEDRVLAIQTAITEGKPFNAELYNAVKDAGIELPIDYVQKGELFVKQPLRQQELLQQESPLAIDRFIDEMTAVSKEIDLGVSVGDLQQAVVRLNLARAEAGRPPLEDPQIRAIASRLAKQGVKEPVRKAVQSIANRDAANARARKFREKVVKEREITTLAAVNEVGELLTKDPKLRTPEEAEEVKFIESTQKALATQSGKYGEALTTGSGLEYLYSTWKAGKLEGQTGPKDGGIPRLVAAVKDALYNGKGLKNVPKSASAESIKNNVVLIEPENRTTISEALGEKLMQAGDAETVFNEWKKATKNGADYVDDALRFAAYMRLEGDLGLPDIFDNVPLTEKQAREFNEELRDEGLAEDDYKGIMDFSIRPHLKVMLEALGKRQQANINRVRAFQGEQARFTPETPKDVELITRLRLEEGAEGVRSYLENSTVPWIAAIAKDLAPFQALLKNARVTVAEGEGSYAHLTPDDGVGMVYGKEILSSTEVARDYTLLHELMHGVTLKEASNPLKSKVMEQLEELRQRLITSLPSEARRAFEKAVKEDWFTRYNKGEINDFTTLHPSHKTASILYALSNVKELLAQGFTSVPTRLFMQGVKGKTSKQSLWKTFVRGIKALVGLGDTVNDNALGEFLSYTGALLHQGEFALNFGEFATQHYISKGHSPELARAQSRRALGFITSLGAPFNKTAAMDLLAETDLVQSPYMASAITGIRKMGLTDQLTTTQVLRGQKLAQGMDGLNQLFSGIAQGELPNGLLSIDLLPDDAAYYLFEKARDAKDVLEVVQAASKDKTSKLLNLADARKVAGVAREVLKSIDPILRKEEFTAKAVEMAHELNNMEPRHYFENNLVRAFPDMGKAVTDFLEQPAQLAQRVPEAAEHVTFGHQMQARARNITTQVLKSFGTDFTGNGTIPALKKVLATIGNKHTGAVVDRWIGVSQKVGKASGKTELLLPDHPEVAPLLKGLTPEQVADVFDVVQKRHVSTVTAQREIIKSMQIVGETNATGLLNRLTGLKHKDNLVVAHEMFEIMKMKPEEQALAQQRLQVLQQKITPEAFSDLFRHTQKEVAKLQEWQRYFDENPDWSTAKRYGKYDLLIQDPVEGELRLQANSAKDAKEQAAGRPYKIVEKAYGPDTIPNMGPQADKLLQRIVELEESQFADLEGKLSPEVLASRKRLSVSTQLAREILNNRAIPNFKAPARNLTKGAKYLPYLENHFSWVQQTANYWSRAIYRAQNEALLLHPEISNNKDLATKLSTHASNLLRDDPAVIRDINRAVATWFMGFNPATAIANGFQPFTRLVSELTAIEGNMVNSYSRVIKAMKEIAGHKLGGKNWANSEHEWLMAEALKQREIDPTLFDENAATEEANAMRFKETLAGRRPRTVGDTIKGWANTYSNTSMMLFRQVERINNTSAILAAYDLYREQGFSKVEAKDKAFNLNHAVNDVGGRANRSIGAFSGEGPFPRSVAMLSTALQGYTLGTTFQLARFLKQGARITKGQTPHEVWAGRKAVIQMLGTQLFLAGALGLPFVSGAIALLDKTFPDFQINKGMRERLNEIIDPETQDGQILNDIALTGLPSVLGWDMQSRLSMGNMVPGVTEFNGFQPELLAGPTVSMLSNFMRGTQQLASGRPEGGLNFIPPAIKKMVEFSLEGGRVRDYRGKPTLDPTAGETLGIALGFQPKAVSDMNVANRILTQNAQVTGRRKGQFHTDLANEVLKGNLGTVREAIKKRAEQDPLYDPADAIRTVARVAEDLTFVRDLRREGTESQSPQRLQLLRSLGVAVQKPSEQARVQFRQKVQAKLGLTKPETRAMRLAQVMDQLSAQKPELPRAAVKAEAERLVQRQSPAEFAIE